MNDRRIPIVLDIETEPDKDWIERTHEQFCATLEPPANYKSEDAIERWFQTKVDERVGKAALSPLDGKISAIGIGLLWDDAEPYTRLCRGDEAGGIKAAIAAMEMAAVGGTPILCGWHINSFDVSFITARAAKHSIKLPSWWPANYRRFGSVLDGADILDSGRLASWLSLFDLPPKLGDGKDAPNLPDDELLAYLRQDVLSERALLRRLALVSHELAATKPDLVTQ